MSSRQNPNDKATKNIFHKSKFQKYKQLESLLENFIFKPYVTYSALQKIITEGQGMPQLKHAVSAIDWCFAGLLLTILLMNIIGFISPFWGRWMHPEDLYASRNLLQFWQVITPWFSVCFAVAAWHLAMAYRGLAARVGIIAMGVLIPVAYIGSSFAVRTTEQEASGASYRILEAISMLANAYIGLAALVFIALVWWVVRQVSKSMQPTPEQSG